MEKKNNKLVFRGVQSGKHSLVLVRMEVLDSLL